MDLRTAIRNEVLGIEPLDRLEFEHKGEVLAWIDSEAELFRIATPAYPPKHLVSYFLLVDGSSVLLVDHKKAMRWLPTGGHVERGEHPRETVRRELWEELRTRAEFLFVTPLMVTLTDTVGLTAGHTDVSLWYALKGSRAQPVEFDTDEFHDIRWFDLSDLPLDRSDPHLGRFVKKLYGHLGATMT